MFAKSTKMVKNAYQMYQHSENSLTTMLTGNIFKMKKVNVGRLDLWQSLSKLVR